MRRIHLLSIFLVLGTIGWFTWAADPQYHEELGAYAHLLQQIRHREIPYAGFPVELPPLALVPVALLPLVLSGGGILLRFGYPTLFIVGTAIIGTAMARVTAELGRALFPQWRESDAPVLTRFLGFCLLGGQILALHVDVFPFALAAGAALAMVHRRAALAGALLGLGTAASFHPAVLVPGFALVFIAEGRPREAAQMFGAWLGTVAVVLGPILLRDGHGGISLFHENAGLDLESSYGGLVAALHALGVVHATAQANAGQWTIDAPLAAAMLRVQLPFFVLGLGVACVTSWRAFREDVREQGTVSPAAIVRSCAAVVAVYMLTSRELSPGCIAWLLPFVVLLPRSQLLLAAALFATTTVLHPHAHPWLGELAPWAILLSNVRNAVLLALCVTLLRDRSHDVAAKEATPPETTTGPVRVMIACGALGFAVWIREGEFGYPPLFLAVASTALVASSLWKVELRMPARIATVPLATWGVAMASIACGPRQPLTTWPNAPFVEAWSALHVVALLATAAYLPDVLGLGFSSRRLVLARRALITLAAVLLCAVAARTATSIDVWHVHQQGAALLLAGKPVYGGAISTIDTHTFARQINAYSYPPMNLLLTTAAYLVCGETRWAQVVCVLVGAALLWKLARRRTDPTSVIADLLVIVLLFHPSGFVVLTRAWGEPLAIPFLFGFLVLLDQKRTVAAAIVLGLFAATKQQLFLVLPFLALVPAIGRRGVAIACATAGLTFLPFVLWTPAGAWSDLVMHHMTNPFRPDSLSVSALVSRHFGAPLPSWMGFAGAIAIIAASTRLPRTVPVQLLAANVAFMIFFLFGRQAFANYYYLDGALILAGFCVSLRRSRSEDAPAEPAEPAEAAEAAEPGVTA